MVLDTEHRQLPMLQSLHRPIVQIDMRHAQRRRAVDRIRRTAAPYRKAVILSRNLDRPVAHPSDRVVPCAMAVQQLERRAAECAGDELVPETDAEHGSATAAEGADGVERVAHGLRVTRAVGDEEAIELLLENVVCRGGGGQDGDGTAALSKELE